MRNRVLNPLERILTDNPFAQRLDNLVSGFYRRVFNTVDSTAVFFIDNNILRNINKTARQITGVCGLQRGIGKTLSGAVRRNKEFDNVQAFFEV